MALIDISIRVGERTFTVHVTIFPRTRVDASGVKGIFALAMFESKVPLTFIHIFILINHDDSNVFSNQDVNKLSRIQPEPSSSGVETTQLRNNIPVITLKLCDFTEELRRKKKEMDTFDLTYSKEQQADEQP